MLQNTVMPCVASPAESVTACCSQMPTSIARSGICSIIHLREEPEGMAGVMPMMVFIQFGQLIDGMAENVLVFGRLRGFYDLFIDLAGDLVEQAGSVPLGLVLFSQRISFPSWWY